MCTICESPIPPNRARYHAKFCSHTCANRADYLATKARRIAQNAQGRQESADWHRRQHKAFCQRQADTLRGQGAPAVAVDYWQRQADAVGDV